MTRRVTIHTPLGEQLHFRELRGQENISQLFSLDVGHDLALEEAAGLLAELFMVFAVDGAL
ncbi:hypothetical protein, partial [Delftia acidovorans]|uniref:hypothetical protein n=1 Tax=Delftia acidovorans TaxID=80866 RepID=UPI0035A119BE